MKVHAHFPTACRAEQTVHAPPERPSGWQTSEAGRVSVPASGLHDHTLPSALRRRRGRAFASTRPHPGASTGRHGIGP